MHTHIHLQVCGGVTMKKSKYKLIAITALLAAGYILIIFARQSHFFKLINEIFRENMLKNAMPSYTYINNIEEYRDADFLESILNDIYPMNEYLIANENYVDTYMESDGNVINTNKNIVVKENYVEGDINSDSESKKSEDNNDENVINIIADENEINTKAESETADLKQNNAEAAAAVSRNTMTGKVYSKAQLSDYNFSKKFYTVTSITTLSEDIFRPAEFLEKDMTLKQGAELPQILVFHTHSQEMFTDSVTGDITTGIVGVGDYLTELLTEKYGYNVIHDRSVYDSINGKLDRSKAYTYANEGIDKILQKYPSIEVIIDLHRDGVNENTHLITEIDGRQTAKIMLFNGISYTNVNGNIDYLLNPYRDMNLATSLQLYLLGQAYYPGFLRNNYINAYRYCLYHREKSMLIEAGAQTNTFEEVKNAMEPLADMLDKLFKGQRAY